MYSHIDPNTPLKHYFDIIEPCLTLDINELRRVAYADEYKKTISLMIGSLRRKRYVTIGHVLNATWAELGQVRNFGIKCQLLLFSYLDRIVHHPECLIHLEVVERNRKITAIKRRLREMGMIQ